MESFYLDIRAIHIASALTSGSLFLIRALAWNLFGAAWALSAWLRYLAWTIDTVLLTAALMLMTITGLDPVEDSWLAVKLLVLLAYVVLGYLALRAASCGRRWAALAGAVLAFGFVYTVARAHHPLGLFVKPAHSVGVERPTDRIAGPCGRRARLRNSTKVGRAPIVRAPRRKDLLYVHHHGRPPSASTHSGG